MQFVHQGILHSKELSRRHNHVVAEPAGDDGIVHDRLVRFVLEIAIPATSELLAGPAIHHIKLFLSRPDLDSGFDAVGGKWAGAVDVPLLEDRFLDLGIAANKIIERLYVRFGAVGCEREAIIQSVTAGFIAW
jgi:hypothetical protein